MDAPYNQVLFPVSFQELFTVWSRFPDAIPHAGGTNLIRRALHTSVFLCLDNIEELSRITRTEHYLEIGSMVKLSKLINLGKIVPQTLRSCLNNIAGVQLRNTAAIGGNICSTLRLLDLPAALTALDAQYELRSNQSSRWISASRFHSVEYDSLAKGSLENRYKVCNALNKQELLTRIRLPLHQWNYAVYKKFYCEDQNISELLFFLARTQKNILSEIRVLFKGNTILRNKSCEDILNGKSLPLSKRTTDEFIEGWKEFLAPKHELSEFLKNSLINSIEENIYNLSE
ncbi:MAG: FAD binding domain-containing protein [Treponema sp.]|nr:FAD binding domain-containing protein [Treponema sp.]